MLVQFLLAEHVIHDYLELGNVDWIEKSHHEPTS